MGLHNINAHMVGNILKSKSQKKTYENFSGQNSKTRGCLVIVLFARGPEIRKKQVSILFSTTKKITPSQLF